MGRELPTSADNGCPLEVDIGVARYRSRQTGHSDWAELPFSGERYRSLIGFCVDRYRRDPSTTRLLPIHYLFAPSLVVVTRTLTAEKPIPPARFELTTFGLGIRRSIQLSYEGLLKTLGVRPFQFSLKRCDAGAVVHLACLEVNMPANPQGEQNPKKPPVNLSGSLTSDRMGNPCRDNGQRTTAESWDMQASARNE